MKLSVVTPVYGCKAALPELHRRLTESIIQLTDDYEIIMVNDACPQNSWEVIQDLCDKDPHVIGIDLSRNFGQMKAILAGLDNSSGDWVVVMDCDLQDRPEEIPNLFSKAQEGYDVVFARRAQRKDPLLKKLFAKAFYKVYEYATDSEYDETICNFSILRRPVVDSYCSMREEHRSYVIYLKWLGYRQSTVDVEHDDRFEGKSSYSFKKRMSLAIDVLTSQSDKLLKLSVKVGLLMAVLSFVAIIALLINYCINNVSPGWTSLVLVMFFLGGIIISIVGLVGIYVGNIFTQVKGRPIYVVRETLNSDDKGSK